MPTPQRLLLDEFARATQTYQSKLTRDGPNDQGTLAAEIRYRAMKCGRTACNRPHNGLKHRDSGREYCRGCAKAINDANPMTPPLVGKS